jgi:transcriptional regulator with XRE-family HTH domain
MIGADIMSISGRIALILNELELPQKAFAIRLGVSRNYINLVVNGKSTSISDTLMLLIEKKFGYSAKWIKTGNGKKIVFSPIVQTAKTVCHTARCKELIKMIDKLSPMGFEHVFSFTKQILLSRKKNTSHN